MDNRGFLENLMDFYTIVGEYPAVRLCAIEHGSLVELRTATGRFGKEEVRKILKYNLGFKLGRCSWIGNKLCRENYAKIAKFLDPRNDSLLLNIQFKSNNKIVIQLRDVYGNVIRESKIKLLSINWFPDRNLGRKKAASGNKRNQPV